MEPFSYSHGHGRGARSTARRRGAWRRVIETFLACIWALGLGLPAAQADGDGPLTLGSTAWDGLSGFAALAKDAGVRLEERRTVDLRALRPEDALILVHPTGKLPLQSIQRFLARGGMVVVLDDFGSGATLLGVYGIQMSQPVTDRAELLRGNIAMPIARPNLHHPLTEGVNAVVTNHPRELSYSALPAVMSWNGTHGALVLLGAVGKGRLLAFSDASLFINNMLAFEGNRALASNLLRYIEEDRVSEDRAGRLLLAAGDITWEGAAEDQASLRARLRDALHALKNAPLPPEAVKTLALTLAALLLLMGTTFLPTRSPYRAERMLPSLGAEMGLVRRAADARSGPEGRIKALMDYRTAVESALAAPLAAGDGHARALSERLRQAEARAATGGGIDEQTFARTILETERALASAPPFSARRA